MRAFIGDFAAAFFVLALVFLLVRPRSNAPAAVDAIAGAIASLVRSATDL